MSSLNEKLMGQTAKAEGASRIKQNSINALDQKRIAAIKTAVLAEGDRIRAKYPILQHQDLIGMAILLFSMAGAVLTGWGPISKACWPGM
jgi:hypothetical protein